MEIKLAMNAGCISNFDISSGLLKINPEQLCLYIQRHEDEIMVEACDQTPGGMENVF
ncbi:hypothetical protein ACJMK2_038693 [Sinanodonta woodiana]|uniref:Uncharacterized protein n=1 Tax=Sinanodonta woodiana TaxID=1069815 RepID=A0ABD3WAM0_SINWO